MFFDTDILLLQSLISSTRKIRIIHTNVDVKLKGDDILVYSSDIGNLLCMLGTTWVCQYTLSIANSIKSTCRWNISDKI